MNRFRPMHQMHAEIGRLLGKGRESEALELFERMPTRYRFVHFMLMFLRKLNTPSKRRTHGKSNAV